MPGRNDAAHGSGAITSKRSPHQHTMSQQVRGSATPPDATKLVITARTSLADSQQRSGKPRSETQPQATTHQSRALPTHPDGAWRWTTQKQARRARVHAPERNDTERPSKFTKQRHPPRRHEARANSEQRRADPGALQRVRMEPDHNGASNSAGHSTFQQATICKLRAAPGPGCHEARPSQLPKRIGAERCPASRQQSSSVTHRKAPAANQPRNNVAGCRHLDAITRKQIEAPTPKLRRGITACA